MQNSTIRILVDADPTANSNKSGVGYYVDGLLHALTSSRNNKFKISGYYFNFLNRDDEKVRPYNNFSSVKVTLIPSKIMGILKQFGRQPFLEIFVPKKYDFTIFTNYVSLPRLRKSPSAVVIYDLGYIDHPEYIHEKNLKYLQTFSSRSIKSAELIITISDFTKRRIEDVFPVAKGRIVVTPIPPEDRTAASAPIAINERLHSLGVKEKLYILFLGTIEPRKNVSNLIKAYEQLPNELKKQYSLVLAGGRGWKDDSILTDIAAAQDKGENVIQTGYISDEEKSALYGNAALFVLPSHYEGFGMPILEAMQYDIPIAVSDIPVFHEVANDAVVYFDKDKPEDIALKIEQLLTDSELRERIVAAYPVQLTRYSWSDNANVVFDAIEQIIKKGKLG